MAPDAPLLGTMVMVAVPEHHSGCRGKLGELVPRGGCVSWGEGSHSASLWLTDVGALPVPGSANKVLARIVWMVLAEAQVPAKPPLSLFGCLFIPIECGAGVDCSTARAASASSRQSHQPGASFAPPPPAFATGAGPWRLKDQALPSCPLNIGVPCMQLQYLFPWEAPLEMELRAFCLLQKIWLMPQRRCEPRSITPIGEGT